MKPRTSLPSKPSSTIFFIRFPALRRFTSAKIAFTRNKDPPAESDKKELDLKVKGTFDKIKTNLAAENELSVSVTWTGGGQQLKDCKCLSFLRANNRLTKFQSSAAGLGL